MADSYKASTRDVMADFSAAGQNAGLFILERAHEMSFHITGITLPALSTEPINVAHPQFAQFSAHSVKMRFENLILKFIVGENFDEYFLFHDWIQQNCFIDTLAEAKSAGTLLIYDNHKKAVKRLHFEGLIPIELSSIDFEVNTADPVTASITMMVESYTVHRVD